MRRRQTREYVQAVITFTPEQIVYCVQQWESLDPQATDEHRIKYLAHGNKALEQAALALYHESQGAA